MDLIDHLFKYFSILCDLFRKYLLTTRTRVYSHIFCKFYHVSFFSLGLMIHFMYLMEKLIFIFINTLSSCSRKICWRDFLFPIEFPRHIYQNQLTLCEPIFFIILFRYSICLSVLKCRLYYLGKMRPTDTEMITIDKIVHNSWCLRGGGMPHQARPHWKVSGSVRRQLWGESLGRSLYCVYFLIIHC